MILGFALIAFGVVQVLQGQEALPVAILATIAGLLVQFIAATFMLIYRSAMSQAQGYVEVLERINAVGMSIQILESVESATPELRDNARIALATDLLRMYAPRGGPSGPAISRNRQGGASG